MVKDFLGENMFKRNKLATIPIYIYTFVDKGQGRGEEDDLVQINDIIKHSNSTLLVEFSDFVHKHNTWLKHNELIQTL